MSLVFVGLPREISVFVDKSNFVLVTCLPEETRVEGDADMIRLNSVFPLLLILIRRLTWLKIKLQANSFWVTEVGVVSPPLNGALLVVFGE